MIYLYKDEVVMLFLSRTPIESKIGGKILSQKHVKTSFYRQFSI